MTESERIEGRGGLIICFGGGAYEHGKEEKQGADKATQNGEPLSGSQGGRPHAEKREHQNEEKSGNARRLLGSEVALTIHMPKQKELLSIDFF